jgi:hypothetical protein
MIYVSQLTKRSLFPYTSYSHNPNPHHNYSVKKNYCLVLTTLKKGYLSSKREIIPDRNY